MLHLCIACEGTEGRCYLYKYKEWVDEDKAAIYTSLQIKISFALECVWSFSLGKVSSCLIHSCCIDRPTFWIITLLISLNFELFFLCTSCTVSGGTT